MKYRYLLLFMLAMIIGTSSVGAKEFKDVSKQNGYYEDIQALTDLGIIQGYEDGTFKPNNYITNRQTATMIVRYLEAENLEFDKAFMKTISDVSENDSAFHNMATVLYLNIMAVYDNVHVERYDKYTIIERGLKFTPNQYTNRAHMARAVVKALGITGDESIVFKDQIDVAFTAEEIGILASNGIVNGVTKDTYAPEHPITRAQFSKILNRSIQLLEKDQNSQVTQNMKLLEARTPLQNYFIANPYSDLKVNKSAFNMAYDNGRWATIMSGIDNIRFLDMNTLKTTTLNHSGNYTAMHGDLVAYTKDYEATLIDLNTKIRQPNFFIYDNENLTNVTFSNNGRYIIVQKYWSSDDPQYIYDIKTNTLSTIPILHVDSEVAWHDDIAYIYGDYNNKTGLYRYNPTTKEIDLLDNFGYKNIIRAFNGDNIIFTDYFYHGLYNMTTGKIINWIKIDDEATDVERWQIAVDDNYVYYFEDNYVKKKDIKTLKSETIYTATSKDSFKDVKMKVEGNYLFIYGTTHPFTIIKVQN